MFFALAGDSTMTRGLGITEAGWAVLPLNVKQGPRYLVPTVNPTHLIETFGTLGVIGIIFAETGLLIGFFLPGDSLLVTAGLLASQGKLNLAAILVGTAVASIVGAQTGYLIGAKVGPALFRRPDSRLFRQEYVDRLTDKFVARVTEQLLDVRVN